MSLSAKLDLYVGKNAKIPDGIKFTDINITDEFQQKYNGVLAKDIIEGNLHLPIFDYQ